MPHDLTIRWTIGNVHPRGFELLRISIICAMGLFGPHARYIVYVNSLDRDSLRHTLEPFPLPVLWHQATLPELDPRLAPFLGESLIEGMGWKLVPLRARTTGFELCLDNDCVLWDIPASMEGWLRSGSGVLFAEDAVRCLGSFDHLCPPGNFNAGIRGLPPHVDLGDELRRALDTVSQQRGRTFHLAEEIEEQGLQAAAIFQRDPVYLVTRSEVSLCSPFWPKTPGFGSCGAHFVGINAWHTPWDYYGRPADDWLTEHWTRSRPELYERAGLSMPEADLDAVLKCT